MEFRIQLTGVVSLALMTGCLALFAQPPVASVDSSRTGNSPDAQESVAPQYRDPVAYCQAIRTIHRPDSRYIGPKLPAWMARDLNLKPEQGSMMEWRCADGAVMACVYGANIPCDSTANTSQAPAQAVVDYCKHNKNSSYVPKYVTGHNSAVNWTCHVDKPVVISVDPTDAEGYTSAYWHRVQP
jgi:hypothetical protein